MLSLILSLFGQEEALPPGWQKWIGETFVSAFLFGALWLIYTERIVSGHRYRRDIEAEQKRTAEAHRRAEDWKRVAVELGLPIAKKAAAALEARDE